MRRNTVIYRGHVQGVGFRWRVVRALEPLAVTGFVRNLPDGTVELVVEGDEGDIDRALERIDAVVGGFIRGRRRSTGPATGEFESFGVRR